MAGATLVVVNLGVAAWFAYAFGPKRLRTLARKRLAREKATQHLRTWDKAHIQDLTPDQVREPVAQVVKAALDKLRRSLDEVASRLGGDSSFSQIQSGAALAVP